MKITIDDRNLILCIAISFGVAGAIYWPMTQGRINLTSQHFISQWAIVALVCGFVGSFFLLKRQIFKAIVATLVGMEAAIFANVIFELLQDSSSHNLWPFEIIITGAIALPFVIVSGVLGWVLSKKSNKT